MNHHSTFHKTGRLMGHLSKQKLWQVREDVGKSGETQLCVTEYYCGIFSFIPNSNHTRDTCICESFTTTDQISWNLMKNDCARFKNCVTGLTRQSFSFSQAPQCFLSGNLSPYHRHLSITPAGSKLPFCLFSQHSFSGNSNGLPGLTHYVCTYRHKCVYLSSFHYLYGLEWIENYAV